VDRYKMAAALQREPDEIQRAEGIPEIFDYVRDIQPVWDKHCVKCHNYEKNAGNVILVGDMTPSFSMSYYELKQPRGDRKAFVRNRPDYEPDPYSTASGGSKLIKMLMKGHKDVELSELEMLRLKRWADAGTTFAGTYAALNSVIRSKRIQVRGKELNKVFSERCDSCHQISGGRGAHRRWPAGEIQYVGHVYNVTRPEKSLLLQAPLAKEAGGLGLCRRRDDSAEGAPQGPIFADTDDPGYQALHGFVKGVVGQFGQPRWFQEGHMPARWYIREMKRFGALPEDYDPMNPTLSGYEIDERYFNILYEMGPGPKPGRADR
jgi:cytochrome c2